MAVFAIKVNNATACARKSNIKARKINSLSHFVYIFCPAFCKPVYYFFMRKAKPLATFFCKHKHFFFKQQNIAHGIKHKPNLLSARCRRNSQIVIWCVQIVLLNSWQIFIFQNKAVCRNFNTSFFAVRKHSRIILV